MSKEAFLKEADEQIGFATLVKGEIEGQDFWAYVAVRPSKYDEFLELKEKGEPFRLTEYGDILEYKIGECEPSQEVKDRMKAAGLDDDFEDRVETATRTIRNYSESLSP